MSQSEVDDPTQFYMEPHMGQDERFNAENWPHDRQPNPSQYSNDSDESRVLCSLEVSLAQESPETPITPQTGRAKLSKEAAAEQIERVGITVFPVGDHTGALYVANGMQSFRSRYCAPGGESQNRLNGGDECRQTGCSVGFDFLIEFQ